MLDESQSTPKTELVTDDGPSPVLKTRPDMDSVADECQTESPEELKKDVDIWPSPVLSVRTVEKTLC